MIPRYSTAEMSDIWSTRNKYKLWLKIELYACEMQEKLGVIPKNKSSAIISGLRFVKINKKELINLQQQILS